MFNTMRFRSLPGLHLLVLSSSLILLAGCSTQKATWPNVQYHNITTHYNIWWNGNESLKSAVSQLEKNSKDDYTGVPYDGSTENRYIAVYPDYYSTWDAPNDLQPFAERFLWAKDNDPVLYSDLSKLVIHSNYAYTMNPNSLSRYYSANLSVTKEIGDHISVSFYANNFWNNMKRVRSSQTGLETSLFDSSYIPAYYYGLSLRLKI